MSLLDKIGEKVHLNESFFIFLMVWHTFCKKDYVKKLCIGVYDTLNSQLKKRRLYRIIHQKN